jgi:iron complex transport system permease protein
MKRPALTFILLLAAFVMVAWVRLRVGPGSTADPNLGSVLLTLRVQAVVIASLAGAALSVAGLLMQGLFRNPLAEPGILGVGAGANLGGMLALAFGETMLLRRLPFPNELYLSLGCIVGAVLALLLLLAVMRVLPDSVTVLLTGVVLTTLLGSIAAVFRAILAEKWELARAILTFSMGDITGKGIRHILLGAPLVTGGILAAFMLASHLDVLASGEEEAATLGVDIERVRLWTVLWTGILVAAAVAIGGGVPFVGLLVPHVMRGFCGFQHRRLLPFVALGGALLLVACDCLSVAVDTKSLIPLGGITGLLGAPLFLFLLLRGSARAAWR